MFWVAGCGRSGLERELDAGLPDSGSRDAGVTDAGVADAGSLPALCPPADTSVNRVWGNSPLGSFDFRNVWTGTEAPTSHSCPHVTVFASPGVAPDRSASLTVDFNFAPPPILGASSGRATLTLAGKTATVEVQANVTRADGLTMANSPPDQWRTSLTFRSDGGWALEGVVHEAPDCTGVTWYCL